MIDAARIRRNTLFAFAATLTRMLSTMFMFVGIARFFGPNVFGQFTLAHTYLTVFYILADFGIDTLLVAELAYRRSETRSFIQRFFSLKIFFSLLAMGMMCGLALLSPMNRETAVIMIILSAAIIGNGVTTFVVGILKGHEEFSFEARVSLWQNLFLLSGLVLLGLAGADVLLVAGLFVLSKFAGFLYVLPRAVKVLRQNPISWSTRSWRQGFAEVLPFGLHLFLGTLYFQLDTILLSFWNDEYWVGIYQSAIKLVLLALVISDVASNALMPTLSRLLRRNEEEGIRMVRLLAKILLCMGLPVAWIFFFFPETILSFVYGGGEFILGAAVLKLLAITVFLRFSVDAYAVFLTASGKQVRRTLISGVATLLSLVLNIILIPVYGIVGAAVVSVLVHLVAGALVIAFLDARSRLLVARPDRRATVTFILLVLVGSVVTAAGAEFGMAGPLMIVVTGGIIIWVVGLSPDERNIIAAVSGAGR